LAPQSQPNEELGRLLSHGRVMDERMLTFMSVNPVKYVTLLRAAENMPVAERR